jgi:hypothetical protein
MTPHLKDTLIHIAISAFFGAILGLAAAKALDLTQCITL